MNGKLILQLAVLFALLGFAGPVATVDAQAGVVEPIIGSWEMEDAYTLHVDGPRQMRIESHESGRFTIDLIVYSDGTGVLGDTGFSWRVEAGAVVWDLGGRSVRVLPRPINEDTVIILALVEGNVSEGASMSVLHRQ